MDTFFSCINNQICFIPWVAQVNNYNYAAKDHQYILNKAVLIEVTLVHQ